MQYEQAAYFRFFVSCFCKPLIDGCKQARALFEPGTPRTGHNVGQIGTAVNINWPVFSALRSVPHNWKRRHTLQHTQTHTLTRTLRMPLIIRLRAFVRLYTTHYPFPASSSSSTPFAPSSLGQLANFSGSAYRPHKCAKVSAVRKMSVPALAQARGHFCGSNRHTHIYRMAHRREILTPDMSQYSQ